MGLDVYLKKCANREEADRLEQEYEKRSEAVWDAAGEYSIMTEEEKDSTRAATEEIAEQLGLDKCGGYTGREDVELSSKIDADHLFKIGYFRSSYNAGGIDHVMRNLGLPDLQEIMGVEDGSYHVVPDWNAALARAEIAIAKYSAHLDSPAGAYEVIEIRPMFEYGVESKKAALDLFMIKMETKNRDSDCNSFSNRDGEFHLNGVMAHAFITKKLPEKSSNPLLNFINSPSLFAVVAKDKSDKPDWHFTALQIVKETIEYVIAQPDRANYYMSWSG